MAQDKFTFILLELPKRIDSNLILSLNESIDKMSIFELENINKILKIERKNTDELNEKDLFDIGEDAFLEKKSVQLFLKEAVTEVLIPRLNQSNRIGTNLNMGEFSYVCLGGKDYAISGFIKGYYSSKPNLGYKYVLGLSLSNLLEPYIRPGT